MPRKRIHILIDLLFIAYILFSHCLFLSKSPDQASLTREMRQSQAQITPHSLPALNSSCNSSPSLLR